MRLAVLRATVAALVLACSVVLPGNPAGAAADPYVDFAPPTIIGTGNAADDVSLQVVNTGGGDKWGVRLRMTVTPVDGHADRPIGTTLVLQYRWGLYWRDFTYETRGDTLVATTPDLAGVSAGGTAYYPVRIYTRPSMYEIHVDEEMVNVVTEALDDRGTLFATDHEPDRISLVEPRAELTGWPEHLAVGTPAVVTVSITNTTPLDYVLLDPALYMNRLGNDTVVVERLDGDQWTPVSGPSSGYVWFYAETYPSLKPGETYSATLRITFTDDAVAGERGYIYHMGYTIFGQPIALDVHPYTLDPREQSSRMPARTGH